MIVPKVTALPETTALWASLRGDHDRVVRELRLIPQQRLMTYRRLLRELAREVDTEIHTQYNADKTTPTETEGS